MNFALERRKNGGLTSGLIGGLTSVFGLTVFFFAILAIFSFPSETSAATLSKPTNAIGLVGWWTFDGADMTPNVRDRSGNGNHGNLYGQTSTTTVTGKLGQALNFDNIDDYIEVPANSTINNLFATGGSVSFWVNLKSAGQVNAGFWITKANSYALFANSGADNSSVDPGFEFNIEWSGGSAKWRIGTANINYNKWQHIVLTYDVSSTANDPILYIDGLVVSLAEIVAPSGVITADTGVLDIAGFSPFNRQVDGAMDEVRLYKRILSPAEVRGLYNSASAKLSAVKSPGTLSTGLVGHWTFDGKDMTPNVRDVSGSEFHGNLLGQISTTTVPGKSGQAIYFDGVDDIVQLPSSLPSLNDFTISFWGKLVEDGGRYGAFGILFSDPYFLIVSMYNYTTASFNGIENSAGNILASEGWNHFTITRTGSNVIVYKNNAVFITSYDVGASAVNFSNLRIGQGGSYSFKGAIDDFKLYNRALSLSEIQQMYNLGELKTNASTNVTKSTLDTGLVGLWSFDGKDLTDKVYDRSGQGNHGYVYNSATTTMLTPGKLGQALRFDGVDDYITVSNESNFDFDTTSPFSISAWVKYVAGGSPYVIVSKQQPSGNYPGIDFRVDTGNERISLYFIGSDGSTISYATPAAPSSPLLPLEWHHAAMTYDGSGTSTGVRMYIDGVALGSGGGTLTASPLNNSALIIGGNNGGSLYKGSLDDVRVYNRTLSVSEVKQLYNRGR